MNKRTQILKQLTDPQITKIQKGGDEFPSDALDASNLQIKEAHPSEEKSDQKYPLQNLLVEQINSTADQLKIQEQYLVAWLGKFQNVPLLDQFALLRLVQHYGLDPFLEEVDLVQYEDKSWQAIITTQGYAKLINACPQFKGMHYAYSEPDTNFVSEWIECAISRTDRDSPIIVREYYLEAKRDSIAWQKMPRRMLRNRAFQQCAKLALGI